MQTVSSYALTAKAIKTALKKAFLGIKFSVYIDSYSMGKSINVSWTNGPTKADVAAITNQYKSQAEFIIGHRHTAA